MNVTVIYITAGPGSGVVVKDGWEQTVSMSRSEGRSHHAALEQRYMQKRM